MNFNLAYAPSIAASVVSVVAGGVVIASGGSVLQSGVAAITTGASGYMASAWAIQTQVSKQKSIEAERDRLRIDVEQKRQALRFGADLAHLQRQQELLQQNVNELKDEETDLQERVRLIQHNPPNLEELEQRQQRLGELQAQINSATGQLKAIATQITEKEQQRDSLQEVTAQFLQKQEAVKMLTEDIRELNQKAAELELFRSTYDALKTDSRDLEAKKRSLESELPRLEQERDRILAEIGTMEARAQQVDALRVQIENLEAKLRGKTSTLSSVTRQLDQLNSDKNLLDDEIARKNQELKKIKEDIRKLQDEKERIEDKKKEAFRGLQVQIWDEIEVKTPSQFASESEFLSKFKGYLSNQGLAFPERIINAFYTSLKVQDISALVVLAGISGTGKSQLPKAFARFIGAPLVNLPVQPRWDSPQDLQGFYNYIEKKYKPTDLMHYLYQYKYDSRLKGRICLVLLDEMNLAKVEYYFSDFLSKLEDRRSTAELPYIDLEVGDLDLSSAEKRIHIPNEFLFVGTMNEDETTQALSDKVLDRANVLTFGRPKQLQLLEQRSNSTVSQGYLSWESFKGWTKEPSNNPHLTEKVKYYVDAANEIMEVLGRPFAHRVYQAFAKYVINYPNADRDEAVCNQAIADQFGQKLLPKLRGVMVEESTVKEQLDKLTLLLGELRDDALNEAFKKARQGQYGQFQWKGMVYRLD